MLAPRKRPVHLLITVTFCAFILFFYYKTTHDGYTQLPSYTRYKTIADHDPANATLGFGAIAVVSKDGSTRRPPLLQAANVTDILLTIPSQPQWTDEDVNKFNSSEESDSGPTIGSIYAWLGHHNVLRWFLDSGLETALILEDDVDFDIQLRSLQVPLAAHAARSMIPSAPWNSTLMGKPNPHYWGNPAHWDLLYLGHCGDYFNPISHGVGVGHVHPEDLSALPHELYVDPTMPMRADLHPYTSSLFTAFKLPEQTRAFHRSKFPLCTFGYAVTRSAAERLLTDLAPASNPSPEKHFAKAYDVAILQACRHGSKTPSPTPEENPHPHPDPELRHKYASPGLRCWTVNPELFHHMPGDSQIAQMAAAVKHYVGIPPVDAEGAEQVRLRKETSNIGCGFWGGAFAFEEGDSRRLEYLREEVGRKGRCLKKGKSRRRGGGGRQTS